jgi:hypothetical protein
LDWSVQFSGRFELAELGRQERLKSEEELKQLAADILARRIFTSGMIQAPQDIPLVFTSFLRLNKLERKELKQKMKTGEAALFYEYLSRAGATSVNGMPTFSSVQTLAKLEVREVQKHIDELNRTTHEEV